MPPIIILSLFLLIGKGYPGPENDQCSQSMMQESDYMIGSESKIENSNLFPPDFIILANKDSIAKNFVSSLEEFYIKRSDTSTFFINPTNGEYERMKKWQLDLKDSMRNEYKEQATELHHQNNNGQLQVWLINNSPDTIRFPLQDWYLICILEAKNEFGDWKPIEYWMPAMCGNSYYLEALPPNTANSFISYFSDHGNFSTVLRYKLLGYERFYYSNEFDGKINYCEFECDNCAALDDYSLLDKFIQIQPLDGD